MLSKVCIFDILNNLRRILHWKRKVVNCFQKFVSLIFWTTYILLELWKQQLWIAFKSLYLWYSEQLILTTMSFIPCCELLSKVCIFDILNNNNPNLSIRESVVNCFQKFVSLIFWTTVGCGKCIECSCELLSKVCIFDILNNDKNLF